MHGHLPRLIYSGPIGDSTQWRELQRTMLTTRFGYSDSIYHLFNRNGTPIYVGKSAQIDRRFVTHAHEKPWWPKVRHAIIYRLTCESHSHEPCRGSWSRPWAPIERAALLWERAAIVDLRPRYNIAGIGGRI
jgi:hypothetical protein